MKNFKFTYTVSASILLLIIISGCSLLDNKKPSLDSDWENEILLAQSCGMDGLMCCPDKDPSCQFGQVCCTDPNDEKKNYCADDCSFGGQDTFCRLEEPKCDADFTCHQDRCTACGNNEEPCCVKGNLCSEYLVCYKDTCLKCGLPGNPCCSEGLRCESEKNMDETRTECRREVCTYCGSGKKISCANEPSCLEGHLLNNNLCLPCGNYNQPCCVDDRGENKCDGGNGLSCNKGFCAKIN